MAFGTQTINLFGGAIDDLFGADALRFKARGNRMEAEQYGIAAEMARQNAQFAKVSTDIKTYQTQRSIYQTTGQQRADVAASGFAASGSALDLLRDSFSQGALHKAVVGQQGMIEEAGYEAQAKSYDIMRQTALMAAEANENAITGRYIGAAIKGLAGVATLGI